MINYKEKIYTLWQKMIVCCEDKKNIAYPFYGAKNITVCEEWHEFQNFYKWVIKNNYTDNKQLIRKNKNKGFCPDNCILANDEYCKLITVKEKSRTIAGWAKYLSIDFIIVKYWFYHGILYTENQILWLMQATDKKPETSLTVYNTTLDYISWSHILDLYRTTVYQWVSRKGKEYAAERIKYILNHPVDLKDPKDMKKYIKKSDIDDKRKKMLTINGETKYLNQWANKIGCTQSLISHWIKEYGKTYAAKIILEKINHPSYKKICL